MQHRFVSDIPGSEHLYAGRSIYEYFEANMGTMLDALDPRSDADKLSALADDDEVKGFFIYFFQWAAVLLLGGIKGGHDTDCSDDLLQAEYGLDAYNNDEDFAFTVDMGVDDCNQLIAHIAQLYEDLTQIKNSWGLLPKAPVSHVLRAIKSPQKRTTLRAWWKTLGDDDAKMNAFVSFFSGDTQTTDDDVQYFAGYIWELGPATAVGPYGRRTWVSDDGLYIKPELTDASLIRIGDGKGRSLGSRFSICGNYQANTEEYKDCIEEYKGTVPSLGQQLAYLDRGESDSNYAAAMTAYTAFIASDDSKCAPPPARVRAPTCFSRA